MRLGFLRRKVARLSVCTQQRWLSCADQPSRISDNLRSLAGRRPSPAVCNRLLTAGGPNPHKRGCGPDSHLPRDVVLRWLSLMATSVTANSDSSGYPTSAVSCRLRLAGPQGHRSQAFQPLPAICASGARHPSPAATRPVLERRVPPPRLRAALRPQPTHERHRECLPADNSITTGPSEIILNKSPRLCHREMDASPQSRWLLGSGEGTRTESRVPAAAIGARAGGERAAAEATERSPARE